MSRAEEDFLHEFLGDGKRECVMLAGPKCGLDAPQQGSANADFCPENTQQDSTVQH